MSAYPVHNSNQHKRYHLCGCLLYTSMSDLNLENIVGFKAVDKNGNERQVTVDEMTELVSARIVSAASEISTSVSYTHLDVYKRQAHGNTGYNF